MKTKAVRLYGEKDLRLEEFDLRPITDGEILIKIVSDSVCMSTHKTALQGAKHLRVPDNVADNPIIIGHEFCGEVIQVGEKWKNEYKIGDKVVAPPVLAYLGGMETIGYTFPEIGGNRAGKKDSKRLSDPAFRRCSFRTGQQKAGASVVGDQSYSDIDHLYRFG